MNATPETYKQGNITEVGIYNAGKPESETIYVTIALQEPEQDVKFYWNKSGVGKSPASKYGYDIIMQLLSAIDHNKIKKTAKTLGINEKDCVRYLVNNGEIGKMLDNQEVRVRVRMAMNEGKAVKRKNGETVYEYTPYPVKQQLADNDFLSILKSDAPVSDEDTDF